jgi:hypothetical protein
MAKFLVMNVNHAAGISKKTGKGFDFTTLTAYKPKVENNEDFKGMKPMEFFCEDDIFKSIPELPAICEVEYDLEPGFNGQARMTVTTVKLIKKLDLQF